MNMNRNRWRPILHHPPIRTQAFGFFLVFIYTWHLFRLDSVCISVLYEDKYDFERVAWPPPSPCAQCVDRVDTRVLTCHNFSLNIHSPVWYIACSMCSRMYPYRTNLETSYGSFEWRIVNKLTHATESTIYLLREREREWGRQRRSLCLYIYGLFVRLWLASFARATSHLESFTFQFAFFSFPFEISVGFNFATQTVV